MDESDLVGRLQDLGFTEYQSRAYVAAVKLGAGTPRELSEASDVPQSRIYDIIDDIQSMGLLEVREASGGKRVVASSPDVTLEALRERRIADLTENIESLASGLERLHEGDEETSHFVTMVTHRDTALRHIRQIVGVAEWWLSLALPIDLYREVEGPITEAVDRGVNVRLVLPESEDTPVGAVEFPQGLQVRQRLLADVLAIADRRYGAMSSLSATARGSPYVIVRDRNLVFLLQNFFEHFWPVSRSVVGPRGFPRRYLDPWRAIKDLKPRLDAGEEFAAEVTGYHNRRGETGTWSGTIVDYDLSGPVDADYTIALPTKANLFVEFDGQVTGVGGTRASRMGVAAEGLLVDSPTG